MNRQEIIDNIEMLSRSQGFYGRLYNAIISGNEEAENYLDNLEEQNFKDVVDMILYIEG